MLFTQLTLVQVRALQVRSRVLLSKRGLQGWIKGGGMADQRLQRGKPTITIKLFKIGRKCRKACVIPSHREFLDPPLGV